MIEPITILIINSNEAVLRINLLNRSSRYYEQGKQLTHATWRRFVEHFNLKCSTQMAAHVPMLFTF